MVELPHAVRRLVTCVSFWDSHAVTLADVGVHVAELLSVPATKSQSELEQLVAPAASATSHAVTLTHAVQKSTSKVEGPVLIVYLDAESSELSLKNDRRRVQSLLNEATAMEFFCVSVKEEMPDALAASSHAVTTSNTPNSAAY